MPLKNRFLPLFSAGLRATVVVMLMALEPPLVNAIANLYVDTLVLRRDAILHDCTTSDGTPVTDLLNLDGGQRLDVCLRYGNSGGDDTAASVEASPTCPPPGAPGTYYRDIYIHQPTIPTFCTRGFQTVGMGPTAASALFPGFLAGFITPDGGICQINCRAAVFIDSNNNINEPATLNNFTTSVRYHVPVGVISVTPSVGSGDPQTFTATYRALSAMPDFTEAWFGFSPVAISTHTTYTPNACVVRYDRTLLQTTLVNDAGTAYTTTLTNSQCSVSVIANVAVAPPYRNLTLTITVDFEPSTFEGIKGIWMYAGNGTYNSGIWQRGTWVVPVPPANLPNQCLLPIPYQNQSIPLEKSS